MKYIVALVGLTLMILRVFSSFEVDITTVGIYIFISIVLLINDFGILKKFKAFGIEMEFDKELRKLSERTEKLEERTNESTKSKGLNGPGDDIRFKRSPIYDEIKDVKADEYIDRLKIRVLEQAGELEKNISMIFIDSFERQTDKPIAVSKMLSELQSANKIDNDFIESAREFWKFRNIVVHKPHTVNKDQLLGLLDIGSRLISVSSNLTKGHWIEILK